MFNKKYLEKIKKIQKNPGTAFGLIYPYILVVIVGIGIYYLANEGNVAQQNIPTRISAVPVVEDLKIEQPKSIPPVDVKKLSVPTGALIEKGKQIFATTCAACHGENGTGTGPGSVGLNPAPRNFTKPEGWINGETISGIFTTLEEGVPNSAMIAYDFLNPEDKFALAHYIRSEFIKDAPMDSESDLSTLDMLYKLSEGKESQGQIPTEDALIFLADENNRKVKNVDTAFDFISKDQNNKSSLLLKKVTNDLHLALSALENSNQWRNGSKSFLSFVTLNANQNGFNGNIFNLNTDEWNNLYTYLSKIL